MPSASPLLLAPRQAARVGGRLPLARAHAQTLRALVLFVALVLAGCGPNDRDRLERSVLLSPVFRAEGADVFEATLPDGHLYYIVSSGYALSPEGMAIVHAAGCPAHASSSPLP
jgi:hypothetical protein